MKGDVKAVRVTATGAVFAGRTPSSCSLKIHNCTDLSCEMTMPKNRGGDLRPSHWSRLDMFRTGMAGRFWHVLGR